MSQFGDRLDGVFTLTCHRVQSAKPSGRAVPRADTLGAVRWQSRTLPQPIPLSELPWPSVPLTVATAKRSPSGIAVPTTSASRRARPFTIPRCVRNARSGAVGEHLHRDTFCDPHYTQYREVVRALGEVEAAVPARE